MTDEKNKDQKQEPEDGIKPAMTTDELRAAGVGIALPTEAASADPKTIVYADGTSLEDELEQLYQENTKGKKKGKSDAGERE